jgi:hypothetical protein
MSYATVRDNEHRERVARKCDRIVGLEALIATWEQYPNGNHDYIVELKDRLHRVKSQLKNMRP